MKASRISLAMVAVTVTAGAFSSMPTYGQTGGGAGRASMSVIEEITITARRREEGIQETPISLLVATGTDLEQRTVTTFQDLQHSMPSLNMMSSALSPNSLNLAMRGNALVDIRLNIDPVVGVYMDGVYLPRNQGSNASDLYDIDRVEVLAGPQSTLYGKNTSSGAVNIISNAPTDVFEGSMRLRAAQHGERQMAGMLNIPMADNVATRIVGSVRGRDRLGRNRFDDSDLGEISSQTWRISTLWTPTDDVAITLRGDYAQSESTGAAWKGFKVLVPNGLAVLSTSFETGLSMPDALAYLQTFARGNPDSGNMNQGREEDFDSWGLSATAEWNINDSLQVKSITAVRAFKRNGIADLDGTPVSLLEYPLMETSDRQISQELQLNGSSFGERLDWVTGLYYSDEEGAEEVHQVALGALTGFVPTIQKAKGIGTESIGIYAQGTYSLTEALSTTIGVRYTEDKRTMKQMNRNATTCLSLGLPLASIGGAAGCVRPMSESFDKITYTFGLEYRPWTDRDFMVYGKTSRGYRSGGLQQSAGSPLQAGADLANTPYDPETVDDIEVGMKSVYLENRLLVNVAAYYSEIDDLIRNVSTPIPGTTAVASGVQNAASATVQGVEWTITAIPLTGVQLNYIGSFIDAEFDDYITPTGQDRSHLPLLFTPKWRHALSGSYTHGTSFGEWRAQLDWLYTDDQLSAEEVGTVGSYALLNGRFSMLLEQHNLEIAIFGKNMTDKRYFPYPVDIISGLGFMYNGHANEPRTFGVEMNIHF